LHIPVREGRGGVSGYAENGDMTHLRFGKETTGDRMGWDMKETERKEGRTYRDVDFDE